MQTRSIAFYFQGRRHEVSDVSPTMTVLDWLRERARRMGTKEGCAEGDCGACTVVVLDLADPAGLQEQQVGTSAQTIVDGIRVRALNACLLFMPALDGKALLTVEDLAPKAAGTNPAAPLHPAQAAMVACHGSQCGFCTPGFIVSLWAFYQRAIAQPALIANEAITRQNLADALSGNLCRCTGYRPILDAGVTMLASAPSADPWDTEPVKAALLAIQAERAQESEAWIYEGQDPWGGGRRQRYIAPTTPESMAQALHQNPGARILGGATDIGLWVNKQMRYLPTLVASASVADLQTITHHADGSLEIGAAVSLERAWAALATRYPNLRELWLRFASLPVRQAGTLGGNLANGSPIGDGAPALLALDAELKLQSVRGIRTLALDAFYLDYMKNELTADEFVRSVIVPPPKPGLQLRAYKVSKRYDSDISALCAGLSLVLDGDRVQHIRLAFGGMAATTKRVHAVEHSLLGHVWDRAALERLQAGVQQALTPLTDLRGSADYRRLAVSGLLERFWLETKPLAPLAASEVKVWAERV